MNKTVLLLSDQIPSDGTFSIKKWLNNSHFRKHIFYDGRDEATRTPDPYVPNVVRYQLRYIPMLFRKRVQRYTKFLNYE